MKSEVKRIIETFQGAEVVLPGRTLGRIIGENIVFSNDSTVSVSVSDMVEACPEWAEDTFNPNLRHCQCGSGEPWASCSADSPYCG